MTRSATLQARAVFLADKAIVKHGLQAMDLLHISPLAFHHYWHDGLSGLDPLAARVFSMRFCLAQMRFCLASSAGV